MIATARESGNATDLRALAARNRTITINKLDVEDLAAVKALAAKHRGTAIDALINNAGLLGDMKAQAVGSLDHADAPSF